MAASLTLVFDHKTRLTDLMLDVQHDHADRVVSSMPVHLTHDPCMEVTVLRGAAAEHQKLAAELGGMEGPPGPTGHHSCRRRDGRRLA